MTASPSSGHSVWHYGVNAAVALRDETRVVCAIPGPLCRQNPQEGSDVWNCNCCRSAGGDFLMAVTKRTRYEVLRRDNHQCRYCGAAAPDVELTVDHVVAIALGGPDEPSNLVAACVDCNAGKSSTTVDAELVADVAQWALTWRAAVAAAAEEMLHSQFVIGSISEELDSRWGDFRAGTHEVPKESFDQLVTAFLAAGITPQHTQDLLLDSIQVAMRNKSVKFAGVWKYFCGVAYTKLRRVHENAIV